MKKIIKKIIRILLSPIIFFDYLRFIKKNNRFSVNILDFYPQIKDKTIKTSFDTHYVYHTAWAARKVKEISPIKHIDISSSLYFCGIVSAFIPVDFYDYRPADLHLNNLTSNKGDLHSLPFESDSVKSISCLHTIEHVGLGRYGDNIDPNGDIKALDELKRVVAHNGSLILVVPVGKPKIEFNAHRIYSHEQILSYFTGWELKEFSIITDAGKLIENASAKISDEQKYGCGCFWFIKK